MVKIAILFVISFLLVSIPISNVNKRQNSFKQSLTDIKHFHNVGNDIEYHRKQIRCLADNIYHESRNQSIIGQISVAQVTINRVESSKFPDNICDVVTQKINKTCQFSWVCYDVDVDDYQSYDISMRVANAVYLYNTRIDKLNDAMFYHASYVSPRWTRYERIVKIEDHIFYREKN